MLRYSINFAFIFAFSFAVSAATGATPPDLSKIRSVAELDAVIASTTDAAIQQALKSSKVEILAAIDQHQHLLAVIRTVEGGAGKVERINTTPEGLKKVAGCDLPVFDTLRLVDLSVANMGPHDKRNADPYDAAFFEHLGHIKALESLNIIATKLNDEGIAPLARLTNLKTLRFTNNGKLTDVGLEKLAGLKNLEVFSFVGTGMQGHAFAKFEGWTRLTRCSFRGSSIDDEGLRHLCQQFPNLENISLAHAKFTDIGAVHLAKLAKLKGLEIGSRNATVDCLRNLTALPLEYIQLGDELDSPAGIAVMKDIPTLRRLTLTHCEKLTDEGLKIATSLTQLENLEIGGLPLSDERLPQLKAFAFLKTLQLVNRPKGYAPEIQAKVKELLPKVDVKFPN